jgi:galactose mutarotase-like enzyme
MVLPEKKCLLSKSENSVTFSIQETKESWLFIPDFELQIKYTLELSCIQISYLVINKDSELPFSIGAHPHLL